MTPVQLPEVPDLSRAEIIWPHDTDEESQIKMALADLHRSYTRAAQPLIDRLVKLQCLKQPTYIIPIGDQQ